MKPDRNGRSSSVPANSKARKAFKVPADQGPWIGVTEAFLSSPAFVALPDRALRVVLRLMLEHLAHGRRENGRLVCTHRDFDLFNVPDGKTADAIREAEALGFVEVVDRGRLGVGGVRRASRYRLTFQATADGMPATDEWNRFATIEQARAALASAAEQATRAKAIKRAEAAERAMRRVERKTASRR